MVFELGAKLHLADVQYFCRRDPGLRIHDAVYHVHCAIGASQVVRNLGRRLPLGEKLNAVLLPHEQREVMPA